MRKRTTGNVKIQDEVEIPVTIDVGACGEQQEGRCAHTPWWAWVLLALGVLSLATAITLGTVALATGATTKEVTKLVADGNSGVVRDLTTVANGHAKIAHDELVVLGQELIKEVNASGDQTTKEIKDEIGDKAKEIREDVKDFRKEVKDDIKDLRREVRPGVTRGDVLALESRLKAAMEANKPRITVKIDK